MPAMGTATFEFSLFSKLKSSFLAGDSDILRLSMADAAYKTA